MNGTTALVSDAVKTGGTILLEAKQADDYGLKNISKAS